MAFLVLIETCEWYVRQDLGTQKAETDAMQAPSVRPTTCVPRAHSGGLASQVPAKLMNLVAEVDRQS